jgi:hypothetical protein
VTPIFPRWTNKIPLVIGVGGPVALLSVVAIVWYFFSPKFLEVGYSPKQPVPFSHKLHAGELGMDCRYCHSTIERAAHAAIPPTETCMGCHSIIKKDSPKLLPVRESYSTGKPIPWVSVHMLPEYAKFNHSAHLNKGVGCVSCHGRIDQATVVGQQKPLSMSWCLDCHRNPKPHLVPKSEITNLAFDPAKAGYDPDIDAHRSYGVNPPEHCGACHY